MTQNVYDEPEFLAGYSKLPRSVEGLDGAAEWASMQALLPGLHDMKVVDLGCGFGWFCRWAVAHVEEWGPTDEQITAHPDWADARDRPMFLLIAAHR